jgi:hypothetical protein
MTVKFTTLSVMTFGITAATLLWHRHNVMLYFLLLCRVSSCLMSLPQMSWRQTNLCLLFKIALHSVNASMLFKREMSIEFSSKSVVSGVVICRRFRRKVEHPLKATKKPIIFVCFNFSLNVLFANTSIDCYCSLKNMYLYILNFFKCFLWLIENSNVNLITLLSWIVFPRKHRMQLFLESQSKLLEIWLECLRTITFPKMPYPDNPKVVSSYSFQIYEHILLIIVWLGVQ